MADTDNPQYAYRVVEVWGDVPEAISRLLNQDDAYLLYPEYRGRESQQDLMDLTTCTHKGGWYMEYAGRRAGT